MQILTLSDIDFGIALAASQPADFENWEREITTELEKQASALARLSSRKTALEKRREELKKS